MTTTPVTLLSKRSGNASDRPLDTTVQAGELAINFAAAENGLYFKDSAGDIRKVTGTHYSANAPNSTPAGETGNSVGETWVDSSTTAYYLSVWNGSSWQKIGAANTPLAMIHNVNFKVKTAQYTLDKKYQQTVQLYHRSRQMIDCLFLLEQCN